jgi:hypothetical protein
MRKANNLVQLDSDGTIPINQIPNLPYADLVNGIVPSEQLPNSALERLYLYAGLEILPQNFGLTLQLVQNGDTVKISNPLNTSNNYMWIVRDDLKLNSADGYEIYATATAADSDKLEGYTALELPISTLTQSALNTKQTVFTGICQEQYLTENDIEIDTVNLKFKINTVKGGTTITALNPICFYTDGNGVSAKHTLSTVQEVSFTNTTGIWYFYFNSSGTLIATQSAWTDFSNIAAVFRMYWNATLYRFVVTSANATLGATYTNNGVTYTVLETITAGTSLKMSGSGLPLASGTLTRASGTGDATITFSTYTFVDRDVVESVEYHKNDVSWIDHAWKHAQGTVWNNGGEIVSNLIANTNGVPNSSPNVDGRNTVVSLTSLSCIDDNLLYTVTNDTANTKFHQDLGNTTAASLTLSNSGLFKIRTNNAAGLLNFLPATRFPFPWDVATNSPQCITSAGVRTLISDNRWFVTYIYSLQDPRVGEAVKVISEVSEFTSYVNAQASSWEGLKALYTTLRDNEIRPLYRLIFYCDKSGGGSYNAAVKYSALVKIDDTRTFRTSAVSTVSGTVLASSVLITPPTGIVATNQQSFDVEIADMFYGRNVTLAAYDIDLSIGENFTKVYANGNAFTISNPIIGKRFRLFISGGTVLTVPTFTGYTTTWIASTLASDYNGTAAVLYAELRSAGALVLFWGE